MSAIRKDFSLDETVVGVLRDLSEAYHLDGSWLAWQYERHIFINGASPFRVSTCDYAHSVKDGVDKVNFEFEFDHENPNLIKWMRFDELPSKKTYIITQTSIKHMTEGSTCSLWLELPKGAGGKEDIGAVQSLLKLQLCCADWRDFLPPNPETALERAQLVVAQGDIDWMRKQVIVKDQNALRLASSLACKNIEAKHLHIALQNETGKLETEVKKNALLKENIANLKDESKAQSEAHDTKVDGLETKLKDAQKRIQNLEKNMSTKTQTIAELRTELKSKRKTTKQPGTESTTFSTGRNLTQGENSQETTSVSPDSSPTPAGGKKRKIAHISVKTPKSALKARSVLDTPKTAPAPSRLAGILFPGLHKDNLHTTSSFTLGASRDAPTRARRGQTTWSGDNDRAKERASDAPAANNRSGGSPYPQGTFARPDGLSASAYNTRSGGPGSPITVDSSSGGDGGDGGGRADPFTKTE